MFYYQSLYQKRYGEKDQVRDFIYGQNLFFFSYQFKMSVLYPYLLIKFFHGY